MHDEPFDFDAPPIVKGEEPRDYLARARTANIPVARGVLLGMPLAVSIWLLLVAVAGALAG